MKKLMVLTMIAAIGCHVFAMDSLNDGLLAYYPLDGHGKDLSDNRNDGELDGVYCASPDHNGRPNGAIEFRGGEHVAVGTPPSLNFKPTEMSCAFWMKVAFCQEGKNSVLAFGGGQYLCRFVNCNSGNLAFSPTADGKNEIPLGIVFPFEEWHHWAVSFASGTYKVYLDGKMIANSSGHSLPRSNWNGLNIAVTYFGNGFQDWDCLNGLLDDLCLYNRELTEDEVLALYGGEVPKGKYRAVSFCANGGTCDVPVIVVEKGETIDCLPYAERLGFDFWGWYTDSTFSTEVFYDFPIDDNINAYARWNMRGETEFVDGCWWYYGPYENDWSQVEILGVIDGTIPNVMRIPQTLNGLKVASIGEFAFSWRDDIHHLELCSNLVNVGWAAFSECPNLESVLIPGTLKKVGEFAFAGCISLTDVTIEHGVEVLSDGCFQNAKGLSELVIPSTVTDIGRSALTYADNLLMVEFKGAPPLMCGQDGAKILYEGDSCFDCSYSVEVFVLNDSGWKDENGDRITQWGFRNVVYGEAFPTFGGNATDQDVCDVVAGTKLENFVRSSNEYYPFLSWADAVCDYDEERKQALKDSPCPWLSYALGLNAPLSTAPTQEALKVTKFSPMSEGRSFDLELAINDIAVSGDATTDNLATVFSVEGCKRLGDGFAADTLTADFSALTDGKVKVRITPKDENADSFFARVGLNPSLVDETDKLMK